ncbi:MAG: polyketide synthase, partial [Balneolaceae bacterium]
MHLTEQTYKDLNDAPESIAIVGMSLRVPGADSLETFWKNLRDGRETITFFTDEELRSAGVDEATLSSPEYVKAMGRLEDVEMFDARFFDMTPKEAEILDPQHRVLMEGVWRALEHAAIDPERYPGRIGLYAGVGFNSYLIHHILSSPELLESAGAWQLSLNNDKDFAPTRIAYKLNLQGPAVSISTACSTSLVSTVMAAQSLLAYQCDTAIAGGCSIHLPQDQGYEYMKGGTVSPDGHCRPFDVDAAGTVDGNGTAVVVLKRLEDAVRDGDTIHALLRGFAINNDGSLKVGYTAPSVSGQSDVILEALEMAEIDPSDVHYVETHGTGTELGDSVEISALSEAFSGSNGGAKSCAIGSVKSNFGHLDTAAGVTGLIKSVLAMQHGEIPPTCHFKKPNPKLGLENGPFFVNNKRISWPETGGAAKIAGVSSFGIGGTNAHVILEEVVQSRDGLRSQEEIRPFVILPLAAKTEDALKQMAGELAAHIESSPQQSLADIAWTLQAGRRHFGFRNFVVANAEDRVACCTKLRAISGAFDRDMSAAAVAESENNARDL